MKVIGIIAEYNPFHNGHLYQIDEIRKKTNADYIIIAMSGDFVQRGGPAIADKYLRAHMALCAGADLVLALPAVYSTASAEAFAFGGVNLFHRLHVVNGISYGCETDELDYIRFAADLFNRNPEEFSSIIKAEIKRGKTYPAARSAACLSYMKSHSDRLCDDTATAIRKMEHILAAPNSILAIEYERALAHLNSDMESYPVIRSGSGHHDKNMEGSICSASALRDTLSQNFAESPSRTLRMISDYIPESCVPLLTAWFQKNPPITENSFSQMLHYQLLSQSFKGFEEFADSTPDLSNRIANSLEEYEGFSSFAGKLQTKEVTYTRVNRLLTHILLDIRQPLLENALSSGACYGKILGFKKNAAPLLREIASLSAIPVFSSLADAEPQFSPLQKQMLDIDLLARNLYRAVLKSAGGTSTLNEYRQSPVILP